MIENDQIDGLDGWFQPWSEHNVETRPLVSVGGTYTIYTGRLDEAQLAELSALVVLPGAQSGSMSFFATSASAGVEASFEPSGVTVSGEVSASEWEAWDFAFRTAVEAAKLPRFAA
jgi:hypothetical protein